MERGVGAQGNTEAMSLKQVRRVNIPLILFPAVKIMMPLMEVTTM